MVSWLPRNKKETHILCMSLCVDFEILSENDAALKESMLERSTYMYIYVHVYLYVRNICLL